MRGSAAPRASAASIALYLISLLRPWGFANAHLEATSILGFLLFGLLASPPPMLERAWRFFFRRALSFLLIPYRDF
jgi:hypothetical protein